MVSFFKKLNAQKQAHASNDPLSRFLLCLQVECPHVSRSTHTSLVHRTLVHIFGFLLLQENSLDKHHGHIGCKFLEARFLQQSGLCVPAGAFHEQTVYICSFPRGAAEVLPSFLSDVTLQTHFVQWPFVFARNRLHDSGEERLRVEETGQPYAAGHGEVGDPGFKLPDSHEKVGVPGCQAVHGRVSSFGPALGNIVKENGGLKVFHVCSDGQFTL